MSTARSRRRGFSPGRLWRPPLLIACDCSRSGLPSLILACWVHYLSVSVVFPVLGRVRFARFGCSGTALFRRRLRATGLVAALRAL